MSDFRLVRYHILGSIRAAMAEAHGHQDVADRLRAQANLRLMVMTEEELQELARMLSFLPSRPAEAVYIELKKAIQDHQEAACNWIGALGVQPYDAVPQKQAS